MCVCVFFLLLGWHRCDMTVRAQPADPNEKTSVSGGQKHRKIRKQRNSHGNGGGAVRGGHGKGVARKISCLRVEREEGLRPLNPFFLDRRRRLLLARPAGSLRAPPSSRICVYVDPGVLSFDKLYLQVVLQVSSIYKLCLHVVSPFFCVHRCTPFSISGGWRS